MFGGVLFFIEDDLVSDPSRHNMSRHPIW